MIGRKYATLLLLFFTAFVTVNVTAKEKKVIGITLHPYYSFVKNIVGDLAEVQPLIGAEHNPHSYEPLPEDIKKISGFDVLVVNGIGHDEFAFEILKAAQLDDKVPLIYANDGVALIPVAGTSAEEKIVNAHTFVSITTSIQQILQIAKSLGEIDPDNAAQYRKNAQAYTRRLRKMKARYMDKLRGVDVASFKCATIHGAYGYFLHEFGIKVSAVIEPRHGVQPSASQLKDTIDKINKLDVDIIFSEMKFPSKYVDTIKAETGVGVYSFSHITGGDYTASQFEDEMKANMESLTGALLETQRRKAN